jgi:archaellum component FlaC
MTPEIVNPLVEMGATLTTYAVKGTVSAVATKVKAIKSEKNIEAMRNSYDEIISELLEEREEIIRIAQAYRSELEKIEISDEDIEHLHKTLETVIDILAPFAGSDIESLKAFKDIVNVDTLKTMQLLGFNYKDAIGVPLTNLCANAILSFGKKKTNNTGNKQKNK